MVREIEHAVGGASSRPLTVDRVFFPGIVTLNTLTARWLTIAALIAPLMASPSALAVPSTPSQIRAAAEAFDRGREAYRNEQWVQAAEHFEQADAQVASPTALEYAMRARERAAQLDRAATLAALSAQRYPNDTSSLGKLSEGVLARARAELFQLTVRCSEACDLVLSGKLVGGAPALSRVLFLMPGEHVIQAGFGEHRAASQSITATAAGAAEVELAAPAAAVAPPVPGATKPLNSPTADSRSDVAVLPPVVFWVGTGLTVIATGFTVWSGIDTINNPGKDKIRADCQEGNLSCPTYQNALSNQRRTNWLIAASAGLGVTTGLIGLVFTDWKARKSEQGVPKDPLSWSISGNPAGVSIRPLLTVGAANFVGAEGRF